LVDIGEWTVNSAFNAFKMQESFVYMKGERV
jgi:hypothetical protein